MKQLISLCLMIGFSTSILAQQTYLTKDGEVTFFSKAPLEDIEAINHKVSAAMDLSTKEIIVKMNMVDFNFDKSLMQEHFNENYIESEKYPTGIYQGTMITDADLSVDGNYVINTSGEITIHGVTKPLQTEVQITVAGGAIEANTKFKIKTADHKIKIPRLVIKNIAEVIDVTANLSLTSVDSQGQ